MMRAKSLFYRLFKRIESEQQAAISRTGNADDGNNPCSTHGLYPCSSRTTSPSSCYGLPCCLMWTTLHKSQALQTVRWNSGWLKSNTTFGKRRPKWGHFGQSGKCIFPSKDGKVTICLRLENVSLPRKRRVLLSPKRPKSQKPKYFVLSKTQRTAEPLSRKNTPRSTDKKDASHQVRHKNRKQAFRSTDKTDVSRPDRHETRKRTATRSQSTDKTDVSRQVEHETRKKSFSKTNRQNGRQSPSRHETGKRAATRSTDKTNISRQVRHKNRRSASARSTDKRDVSRPVRHETRKRATTRSTDKTDVIRQDRHETRKRASARSTDKMDVSRQVRHENRRRASARSTDKEDLRSPVRHGSTKRTSATARSHEALGPSLPWGGMWRGIKVDNTCLLDGMLMSFHIILTQRTDILDAFRRYKDEKGVAKMLLRVLKQFLKEEFQEGRLISG